MIPRVKEIGVWNTEDKLECMGSKKIVSHNIVSKK